MTTTTTRGWTYGAEHELADWDRWIGPPDGFGVDERDKTIVNSNGIAADPKGKLYRYGGEINTPPTDLPEGQADCLRSITNLFPEARVNYRSNLHIHIRVPGLARDLPLLKQIQRCNRDWLPTVLPILEPIPDPARSEFPGELEFRGARRRRNRRRVSHHTVVPHDRVGSQLAAETLEQFFEAEVPRSLIAGKPQWQCQPRAAVNLRQLRETDTIEFRHFPGTLDPAELLAAVLWCREYLERAIIGSFGLRDMIDLACWYASKLPKFPEYVHWMEVRYRATVHDGTVPKAEIEEHIRQIENGTFKGSKYYE